MTFNNPYLETLDKIELLERWIIVQSIMYYEFDGSIVSDEVYDKNAKQLAAMIRDFSACARKSKYYAAFKDYDASTGFDLVYKLPAEMQHKLTDEARWVKERFSKKD